ncbi:serine phosphatase RsbU (regulator of sigma subunit) [Streptomyces sp. PvR006]|uniref:PP2C family protein-serine/threonine phosphatase n=1 Tax=Streptomyces sp. PvR006 TaxID=2817860 RepID=UPI0027DD52E6|nr:PP2C family protein-serine/threonine phosphatase [Streptomyces sp. PvR006]MBP2579846.1 serine phosphatase RsbU (regulator of sigma subunit) [Streptomyces sp. PvR006]
MAAFEGVLADLLARSPLLSGRELATAVCDAGRSMGLTDSAMYVADLQQIRLIALPLPVAENQGTLDIDTSLAGLAYRTQTVQQSRDGATAWVPMIDGAERLGVLKVTAPSLDAALLEGCAALAGMAALLLVSQASHSDLLVQAERWRAMTVQAELLWAFLPPRTIGTTEATSSAVLEPAYDIGGDTFDHSLDDDGLHLTVLDSMGHDLASGGASAAGLAACRATRRSGGSLTDIVTSIDRIMADWFTDRLMTAVVAHLDTAGGVLTWINCGHPAPLLIRAGRVVRHALEREPDLPLGWGFLIASPPTEHRQRLQPGDRILMYSDGVTEARSPDGDLYGEQRLADTVIRATAAGDPAPEALRRLVQSLRHHQDHKLRDDATILLIEWHPTAPGESAHRG